MVRFCVMARRDSVQKRSVHASTWVFWSGSEHSHRAKDGHL